MYARVATFEGGSAEALRAAAEQIRGSEPPPGLPAKGITMLIDPDTGDSITIVLFESEDDYRAGNDVLEGMTPSPDAGRRVKVAKYEVGVEARL